MRVGIYFSMRSKKYSKHRDFLYIISKMQTNARRTLKPLRSFIRSVPVYMKDAVECTLKPHILLASNCLVMTQFFDVKSKRSSVLVTVFEENCLFVVFSHK